MKLLICIYETDKFERLRVEGKVVLKTFSSNISQEMRECHYFRFKIKIK